MDWDSAMISAIKNTVNIFAIVAIFEDKIYGSLKINII